MRETSNIQSLIKKEIIQAVTEMGFDEMTPIQERAIPVLLEGKDIIGQAQTGTGKTAAFGIPLIQQVDIDSRQVQAVVLCPTRELALQVTEELRKMSKYIRGMKITAIFGGQDMERQIHAIKSGTKIVVGTPGRVMDHMRRRTLKLGQIKTVVLDEADEMLNMGFREDIETILQDIPEQRQTALFSATMPKAIMEITKQYQRNAVIIKTTPKELTMPSIDQYYFEIKSKDKQELLCRLMDFHRPKRTLIFCKTKRGADGLAGEMKSRGYHAEPLHGDLSQGQRNAAMAQFRHGKTSILIATDVAARGIDVDDVEAVFNYDIPQEEEFYVHRIGRTGRAGKTGKAFTFVAGKEIYKLRQIESYCKTRIAKGVLPSVSEVSKIKVERILDQAMQVADKQDVKKLEKVIRWKMEETGFSAQQLAAALLQLEMGTDFQDVSLTEHRPAKRSKSKNRYEKQGREKGREGRRKAKRN